MAGLVYLRLFAVEESSGLKKALPSKIGGAFFLKKRLEVICMTPSVKTGVIKAANFFVCPKRSRRCIAVHTSIKMKADKKTHQLFTLFRARSLRSTH